MNNQYSTKKQFILFVIVGCINTLNGVVFATLFSLAMSGTQAFIVGYACSLLLSYLLNTVYVFRQPIRLIRFIKFCISYMPNFVIQFSLVVLLFYYFAIPKLIVYAIAAIIGVPITFFMVKLFALKPKS